MERAKALKVNSGTEPDADLGPVISKQVIDRYRCHGIPAVLACPT